MAEGNKLTSSPSGIPTFPQVAMRQAYLKPGAPCSQNHDDRQFIDKNMKLLPSKRCSLLEWSVNREIIIMSASQSQDK